MNRPVRDTPRWLYRGSIVLIALPVWFLLFWGHDQLFGREPWFLLGYFYIGVGTAIAWGVRFFLHLLWDALTLPSRQGPPPPGA